MTALILVVEDDATTREALVSSLELAGHTVVACKDGQQAIEKLKTESFDLIVCDWLMPKANGLAVLSFLKRANISTKVIVVTGADPFHQKNAKNFGAARIFVKPLNLEKLNKAVAELVRVSTD